MKHICIILLAWLSVNQAGGTLYACKNAKITLYSKAPIEDIEATTITGVSVYNAANNELDFSININSFKFPKALMQEHFNSDYMESDKYPRATFKGKINEKPDLSRDGSYPVTATGELSIHNVTQTRTIPGTLSVRGGVVSLSSEFMVKCADHHIKIPRLVFHNIAESLKITVSATYAATK